LDVSLPDKAQAFITDLEMKPKESEENSHSRPLLMPVSPIPESSPPISFAAQHPWDNRGTRRDGMKGKI
jgi:hypothetical protein